MMTETFINETYGINGITRISLKKIIEVFSFPNEINIKFSNKKKSINIKFIYDGLEVNYMLYFFSENIEKPEYQTLYFDVKYVHLNDDSIKIGDEIKVKIDALGKEYMAKITELNPIADSTTKNFKVKLALDNPDGEIKDGMFGNVIIPVGESSVLSVEDEAIVTRDLVNYVFKYEDGKAKQVEVTVGATNLPYTEISSPEIKEGDKIIVKGLFGLQNNDTVEIKNEVNK